MPIAIRKTSETCQFNFDMPIAIRKTSETCQFTLHNDPYRGVTLHAFPPGSTQAERSRCRGERSKVL